MNLYREHEMSDLFDIYNLADIPAELKKELRQDDLSDQIVELFKIAQRDLSVDEVVVAHYRKFVQGTLNQPKSKKQIMAKLYNIGRDPKSPISPVTGKKGVYRLKNETDLSEPYGKSGVSAAPDAIG